MLTVIYVFVCLFSTFVSYQKLMIKEYRQNFEYLNHSYAIFWKRCFWGSLRNLGVVGANSGEAT